MAETKRKHERQAAQFEVVLRWADGDETRSATFRSRDVSPSGIGLAGSVGIDAGTAVEVAISGHSGTQPATVRYCSPDPNGFVLGVQFSKAASFAQPVGRDDTDFYEILQLSPKAEMETITRVYRLMATRFHPDNPETGDLEKFLRLSEAFDALSDAGKRAAYDASRTDKWPQALPVFQTRPFIDDKEGEANRRLGVLCLLYSQRRRNPDRPSLSLLELEQFMSYPREYLQFTLWYLQRKEYIERDQGAYFTLTADGVDFVEEHTPSNTGLLKLLQGRQ